MTRTVAVFDLDGTLTRWDTSLPFLRFASGAGLRSTAVVVGLAHGVPDLVRALGRETRSGSPRLGSVRGRWEGLLHQRMAVRALAGRTRSQVEAAGSAFAEEVVARALRSDARSRLGRHLEQGHHVVLASASLEPYVLPLAGLLGAHQVVGTRLEYTGEVATGRFQGLPCWGAEKVRRVRALLHSGEEIAYAYGDSAGDRELLAAARNPTWVRGRPLRS